MKNRKYKTIKTLNGTLEVIAGCMFSGKSEELIRRLRRAKIAKQKVVCFKPEMDDRYSKTEIVSHSANRIISKPVSSSKEIYQQSRLADVVGIDEVQFFDEGVVEVCDRLAYEGKRVIAAGLDLDYRGKPFGPMPNLLAVADYVTKLQAVCTISGLPATRSQRLKQSNELVLLGHTNAYEARHRAYFEAPEETE
ncbi:MAG: thymidine kinase [Chloroherpetonaceae bacterium]|nr:thymidine kinase [Chloroherpetonaceae bacterium]